MKSILVLLTSIILFTSCNEYWRIRNIANQGSRLAGGQPTSYSKSYTFHQDSLISEDVFLALDAYMTYNKWSVYKEGDYFIGFEYRSSQVARETTNKQQQGRADFRMNENDSLLYLQLSLNGNYKYGTRENANKLIMELRNYLYGK